MPKYKLLEKDGGGLHRIQALKSFSDVQKGDIGGYVESEHNLSQSDDCWIYDEAIVAGNAKVYGNARIFNNAIVAGNAEVYGTARVHGYAQVYENVKVFGNAEVHDKALVYGNVRIFGDVEVSGNAEVYDNAWVFGNAKVFENAVVAGYAEVYGDAKVSGNAEVYDKAWVFGNTKVSGNAEVYENAIVFGNAEVHDNTKVHGRTHIYKNVKAINESKTLNEREGNNMDKLELINIINRTGMDYHEDDFTKKTDIIWQYFVDTDMFTEDEIALVSSLNGYNEEILDDMLYARFGYRNLLQYLESEVLKENTINETKTLNEREGNNMENLKKLVNKHGAFTMCVVTMLADKFGDFVTLAEGVEIGRMFRDEDYELEQVENEIYNYQDGLNDFIDMLLVRFGYKELTENKTLNEDIKVVNEFEIRDSDGLRDFAFNEGWRLEVLLEDYDEPEIWEELFYMIDGETFNTANLNDFLRFEGIPWAIDYAKAFGPNAVWDDEDEDLFESKSKLNENKTLTEDVTIINTSIWDGNSLEDWARNEGWNLDYLIELISTEDWIWQELFDIIDGQTLTETELNDFLRFDAEDIVLEIIRSIG